MADHDKTRIRKDFLERRRAIEPSARLRDSAIIRQRLFRLPEWEDAGTILCYVSMETEVETRKIIEEALGRRKRVIVPLVSSGTGAVGLSELRSLAELGESPIQGLDQPIPRFRRPAEAQEVEVALIPGVAFDREGGRIGMGGGYFDRLLPQMGNAVRIGLAFSVQLYDQRSLPLADHDVRLHKIVTESELVIPRCILPQDFTTVPEPYIR